MMRFLWIIRASVVQACLEIADRGEIYRERTRRMKEEIFLNWGAAISRIGMKE